MNSTVMNVSAHVHRSFSNNLEMEQLGFRIPFRLQLYLESSDTQRVPSYWICACLDEAADCPGNASHTPAPGRSSGEAEPVEHMYLRERFQGAGLCDCKDEQV